MSSTDVYNAGILCCDISIFYKMLAKAELTEHFSAQTQ